MVLLWNCLAPSAAITDNAEAFSMIFHPFEIEATYGSDTVTIREMEFEMFEYIERSYSKK
jgi:hypothetical protein